MNACKAPIRYLNSNPNIGEVRVIPKSPSKMGNKEVTVKAATNKIAILVGFQLLNTFIL